MEELDATVEGSRQAVTEQEIEHGAAWLTERDRRMALEGLRDDGDHTPEQHERILQIIRELSAEAKAGKVFDMDEVLAHWRRASGDAIP